MGDHLQVELLSAGLDVELTLVVVSGAVAAAHRLLRVHTLRGAHAFACLPVTDRAKRAVGTQLI